MAAEVLVIRSAGVDVIDRAGMMAIYIHDEAAQLRLRVTGDLDEVAARELASCWTTASSVLGSRRFVVDLTSLAAAGDRGRQLLEALHREGVEFLAKSEFQMQLVREIFGARAPARAGASSNGVGRWLKGLIGVT